MRHKGLLSEPILDPMPGPWGRAIAHLRVERKLTQRAVAKRARMTATTYGRIERGQHTQTRKLQDIADVFGVPIDAVLRTTLQLVELSGNTALPNSQRSAPDVDHSQIPSTDPAAAAAIRELQTQIDALHKELATIVADREADHRRRERVSTTGVRKSIRPRNARKAR